MDSPSRSFDTKLFLCRIILKTSNPGGACGAAGPVSATGSASPGPAAARRARPHPRQVSTAQLVAPSGRVLVAVRLPGRSQLAAARRQVEALRSADHARGTVRCLTASGNHLVHDDATGKMQRTPQASGLHFPGSVLVPCRRLTPISPCDRKASAIWGAWHERHGR